VRGEERLAALKAEHAIADPELQELKPQRRTTPPPGERKHPRSCNLHDAVDMTVVRLKVTRLIERQVEARAEERTKEVKERLEALRAEHTLA
jgi:hypothetical protein